MPRDGAAAAPSIPALLRTAEPLRAWLQSMPSDKTVGMCILPTHCVLACFLRAHGFPEARVSSRAAREGSGHAGHPLAAWALEFLRHVDGAGRCGEQITAAGAILCLPVPALTLAEAADIVRPAAA